MSQYGIGISSAGFKNDVTSPVNWSACSSNEEHSHSAVLLTPGDLGAHVNRSDEMLESYLRNFSQTRGIHGGSEQIEELLKNALSSQSHPIVSGSGIESNFGDNSIERFENNEQNEPNTKCSEQLQQFMSTSGVLVLPKLAANLLHYDSDERKQSPTSCLSRKTSPPSTTQSPTSSTELAIGIAAPKPIKTVHQLEFNGNESFSRNLQFSTADSSINIEQSPFFTNSMTTQSLDSGNMLPSTILRNILIASEAQNMTDVDSEVMRDIDNNSDSQMATALEGVTLDRMTSAEGRSDQNDNAVASGEYLNGNQKGSRSFFRAPGLEAPCSDGSAANFNAFECKICGFQSTSKFHYNSHMNTHTFHQCRMCNYTARTEGRLKKHMKASHTLEQRQAVGIEENLLAGPTSGSKSKLNGISDMETNNSKSRNNSTTEVDSNLLKLGINMVPVTISEATTTPLSLPPLDQLRALTERNETGSSVNSDELCESTSMGINRCAEELLENISALTPPTYTQQEQPQTRRSGRPKTYTCKQCGLISKSKEEQWEHARTHIPKEKQLTCNKCRFVTEYKHHLEYHIRNHYNSRPFQCTKCKYTCVNKSMLNSHMKSHTPAYPYRCQDCTYRTKYCHSLKMHLSKYNHRRMPGLEGYEEGIVSPGNIKDEQMDDESLADDTLIAGQQNNGYSTEQQLLNQVNQALIKQPTQIPTSMEYASQVLLNQQQPNKIETSNEMPYLCPFPEGCNYATNSNEELIKHFLGIHFMANQQQTNLQEFQISHQIQQRLAMQQLLQQQFNNPLLNQQLNLNFSATGLPRSYQETNIDPSLLIGLKSHEQKFMGEPELTQILNQIKQFQNCRATGEHNLVHFPERTELNHISPTESKESAECGTSSESPNSEPRRKERKDRKKTSTDSVDVNVEYHPDAVIPEKLQFSCQHCMMGFNDKALYLIHRGYHGFGSPFKCNRCGHVSKNSLEFNMHLYQGKHDD